MARAAIFSLNCSILLPAMMGSTEGVLCRIHAMMACEGLHLASLATALSVLNRSAESAPSNCAGTARSDRV